MDDRRIELVERLNSRLEAVFIAFEGQASSSEKAQAEAWGECEEAFERYREECERCRQEPVPVGLQEEVKRSLKLHAIAVSVIGRQQDWLREEISKVRETRTRLRAFASPSRVGDSCDIQG